MAFSFVDFFLVFLCVPKHMPLCLYVFLLLSLWLFCLLYSILDCLFLFYFISVHYSFWMPVVVHEKECRFELVVTWVWAKRSSKRGNHNHNNTLWKNLLLITKSGYNRKCFVNDYFQYSSNYVTSYNISRSSSCYEFILLFITIFY